MKIPVGRLEKDAAEQAAQEGAGDAEDRRQMKPICGTGSSQRASAPTKPDDRSDCAYSSHDMSARVFANASTPGARAVSLPCERS
jgi:hypothetical protein